VNEVVMVSDLGDVWLTADEARKAATAQAKGVKNVTLRGNIYATFTIKGFLQPSEYKAMYTSKKRSWTCAMRSVHLFNESCRCRTELPASNAKQLAARNDMTPEQQAQADLKASASREWIKHCRKDFKLLADKEKRNAFIAKYMEEHNGEA
jgi:hypothetical protein